VRRLKSVGEPGYRKSHLENFLSSSVLMYVKNRMAGGVGSLTMDAPEPK
jgi:hypothetical protein